MSESELDTPTDGNDLWTEPDVKAITTARPMRAWGELVSALVDEARVHFTEYGVELKCVDPANVGMLDLDWHRDGFKSWNHPGGDVVAGVALDHFTDISGFGRLNKDDPTQFYLLEGEKAQLGMRVTRPDEKVQRSSRWFGIEPDMLRSEPDLPDNVLESYGWKAHLDPKPLKDAVEALDKVTDHVRVKGDDSTLILEAGDTDDDAEDAFRFPNTATCQPWDSDSEEDVPDGWVGDHADDTSLFSLDYLRDMARATHKAKMDRVTLGWGQEFPATLKFAHDEWGISGSWMLAPRIQSE